MEAQFNRDKHSMVAAPDSPAWQTPMFQQYWQIKAEVPEALLFFRMGDFYELFGDDALKAAPLLEVQLTSRDKSSADSIPMCGIPFHAWESYAEKLLSRGHKVALCEQMEAPQAGKKLVRRELVRVLTPGLPVNPNRLDEKKSHWFMSLSAAPKSSTRLFELCVFDLLSSELYRGELENLESLEALLQRLEPKEILISEELLSSQAKNGISCSPLFSSESVLGKRLSPWPSKKAYENLIDYLLYTQRSSKQDCQKLLGQARDLAMLSAEGVGPYARLCSRALEQWHISEELFNLLDGAASAQGSRAFRKLLCAPLKCIERIKLRQKLYESLDDPEAFLKLASQVYDFERLLGRFRLRAAQHRELFKLYRSLEAMQKALSLDFVAARVLQDYLQSEGLEALAKVAPVAEQVLALLSRTLYVEKDDNELGSSTSDLIRRGCDQEFDLLREEKIGAEQWLSDFEIRQRESSGISKLKIRYNRVVGYCMEIPKSQTARVPADYERRQSMIAVERFTCAELKAKEASITTVDAKLESKALRILQELTEKILSKDSQLKAYAENFAHIDAWCGVKKKIKALGRKGPWCLPQIAERDESGAVAFAFDELRHPLVEQSVSRFVPQSLVMGFKMEDRPFRTLLLTGPNMAGKSTLMRQSALALYMAQLGLPVPAKSYRFRPAHAFYSRMGAADRILEGESTFMVEMKEVAEILRGADEQSFVLIDEVGRGTSSQDGLALAQAILEELVERNSCVLFATHYHELAAKSQGLKGLENASLGIEEVDGALHFTRQLKFTPAESSFGLHVARMAGISDTVISRAEAYLLKSKN